MPKTTQSNMYLGIFAATRICIGLTGENFVYLSSVQFIKHLMTILQLEEKKNREKILALSLSLEFSNRGTC